MAEFYSVSLEEMDAFLRPMRFQPVDLTYRRRPVKEWVYQRPVPSRANHFVRVYTGINRYGQQQNQSRGVGKDAIRVQVIYRDEAGFETLVTQPKRVHRVQGWADNLANRLEEINRTRPQVAFDSRGKPMTLRKGRTGWFWGSSDYPRYKETRPYSAENREIYQAPYQPDQTLQDYSVSELTTSSAISGYQPYKYSASHRAESEEVFYYSPKNEGVIVDAWTIPGEDYEGQIAVLIDFLETPKGSKGLGRKEFESIRDWAVNKGAEYIVLESMPETVDFWKWMGFVEADGLVTPKDEFSFRHLQQTIMVYPLYSETFEAEDDYNSKLFSNIVKDIWNRFSVMKRSVDREKYLQREINSRIRLNSGYGGRNKEANDRYFQAIAISDTDLRYYIDEEWDDGPVKFNKLTQESLKRVADLQNDLRTKYNNPSIKLEVHENTTVDIEGSGVFVVEISMDANTSFAAEDNYEATYGKAQAAIRRRLKKKIKAQAIMGTKAGQWSARKSQELKRQYEAACEKRGLAAYKGQKTQSQKNLSNWSQQKWRTASGKNSSDTGEPYFPAKAVEALKDKGLYAKAKRQKAAATKAGKQSARYSDDIRAVVRKYRAESDDEWDGLPVHEINSLEELIDIFESRFTNDKGKVERTNEELLTNSLFKINFSGIYGVRTILGPSKITYGVNLLQSNRISHGEQQGKPTILQQTYPNDDIVSVECPFIPTANKESKLEDLIEIMKTHGGYRAGRRKNKNTIIFDMKGVVFAADLTVRWNITMAGIKYQTIKLLKTKGWRPLKLSKTKRSSGPTTLIGEIEILGGVPQENIVYEEIPPVAINPLEITWENRDIRFNKTQDGSIKNNLSAIGYFRDYQPMGLNLKNNIHWRHMTDEEMIEHWNQFAAEDTDGPENWELIDYEGHPALYRHIATADYDTTWQLVEFTDDLNLRLKHHATVQFTAASVEIWLWTHEDKTVTYRDEYWAEAYNELLQLATVVDKLEFDSESVPEDWDDIKWKEEKPEHIGDEAEWNAEDWGSLRPMQPNERGDYYPTEEAYIEAMLRRFPKMNIHGERGCPVCGSETLFMRESSGKGLKWRCYGCNYSDESLSEKSQKIDTLEKFGLTIQCPDCGEDFKAYNREAIRYHQKKCGA